MAQPYIGEIRMFAGNFAPAGWLLCQGQLLPISENETLFNLIGTTYGGDGQTTFQLPDLRGRIPVHQGTGPGLSTYTLAQTGGVEEVTLTTNQMPVHGHPLLASSSNASTPNALNNVLSQSPTVDTYINSDTTINLAANTTSATGGSQPHSNFQPYLCINFIISLFGIFPSQS